MALLAVTLIAPLGPIVEKQLPCLLIDLLPIATKRAFLLTLSAKFFLVDIRTTNAPPGPHANWTLATQLPDAVRPKQWRLLTEFPLLALRFLVTGNPEPLYHNTRFTDRYFFSPNTRDMRFDRATESKLSLIVIGAEAPTVTPDVGDRLQELMGGEVIRIPDAGHDIMLEPNAETAAQEIVDWIRRSIKERAIE